MTANGPAVRPRLGALARLWVAQRRRSTLGWTLGVVAMTTVTAAMYPTIRNRPEFRDLLDKYPAELLAFFGGSGLDITSPSGYLTIELFSAMAPVLFVAMGIAPAPHRGSRGPPHRRPRAEPDRTAGGCAGGRGSGAG